MRSYGCHTLIIYTLSVIILSLKGFSQEHVEITIKPGAEQGKDSYVNSHYGRLGSTQSFIAAAWTYDGEEGVGRSFIDFKLPVLPDSIANFHVFLNFYHDPTSGHVGHGGDNTAKLERIIEYWTENEVSWTNQPKVTSENAVILPASINDFQDYTNIDVTQLILDMYAQPDASFGFRLSLLQESVFRSMIFASSDHSNPDLWPALHIQYDAFNISPVTEEKQIQIYPNPASGLINIESENIDIKKIYVISSHGSLVIDEDNLRIKRKENGFTCDFTGMESGNYIIYVLSDIGVYTQKEIFVADK